MLCMLHKPAQCLQQKQQAHTDSPKQANKVLIIL